MKTLLIVDDVLDNIDILNVMLGDEYHIKVALDGETALKQAKTDPQPDLILLDIMMPGMDGYTVCRELKLDAMTMNIPVIFITALNSDEDEEKGFELGAVDYLNKPVKASIVRARVKAHLALHDQAQALEDLVKQRTEMLEQSHLHTFNRLTRVASYKTHQRDSDISRVSEYTFQIAKYLKKPSQWCDMLFNAAMLYDIGKIAIPEHILNKPESLDAQEWQIVQEHCETGSDILGDPEDAFFSMARSVCLFHHEKFDGSGYPYRLAGEDIPLEARIMALADVFDALTSHKPYRQAWDVEAALDYIKQQSGQHFDPLVVEAFEHIWPMILDIKKRYESDL